MWISDCRIGWLVWSMIVGWVCCWFGFQIARYFLGFNVLVGQSHWIWGCNWPKMQSIKMWIGVGFQIVVAVFILNFWVFFFFSFFSSSCGFDYFSRFMGLICWRFQWRIGILNEFSHVYLLRKCNKRKENIDCFNFLGNYTCSSCSFPKNMLLCSFENNEKKKRKKN